MSRQGLSSLASHLLVSGLPLKNKTAPLLATPLLTLDVSALHVFFFF